MKDKIPDAEALLEVVRDELEIIPGAEEILEQW